MNEPLTDLLDSAAESWHIMPLRERATFAGQPVSREEMVMVREIAVHAAMLEWRGYFDE